MARKMSKAKNLLSIETSTSIVEKNLHSFVKKRNMKFRSRLRFDDQFSGIYWADSRRKN